MTTASDYYLFNGTDESMEYWGFGSRFDFQVEQGDIKNVCFKFA